MNSKIPNSSTDSLSTVPPVFIEYLKTRGITGGEAAHRFLYPSLADLPKPDQMLNLSAAARLAVDYMIAGKQIIIWGDYDVDGTTGTALLVNFFKELGTAVRWHIPDRMHEGYGLNAEWFTNRGNISLAEEFLLITVDCGISNAQQVEIIAKLGGKIIITDHHSMPEQNVPDCLVLNPSQPSCGFNGQHLAGVGVAFYLAAGIRAELAKRPTTKKIADSAGRLNLKKYLAFVALGTIADVVNLTPTNRILVRAGLEALADPQFTGLNELLTSCEITGGYVTSEDIGYLIGPKINAAGRLGESTVVVELLTEADRKRAKHLAQVLTDLNEQRKRISSENLETALSITSAGQIEQDKCVIVKGDLHQGVAGIVASRLVDMFRVPAIVFAQKRHSDGQVSFVGSARSVDGVNIVALLAKCSQWIERFGGHEMAAGLTVSADSMTQFSSHFTVLAGKAVRERKIIIKKQYDINCPSELMMDQDHLRCLQLLEPFGPGNPQPVFQDAAATILDSRAVGRNSEHLQVTIRGKFANLKGIGFRLGEVLEDVQRQPRRKMIYTPTMNRFRGNVSWQVRVIDI
ncbi:single-stranded-DNA-specific exonuclease RecJ [Desulfopila sp. IMCC35006]|uniref:single-stranded-DNA-specific exonuclease RecJ n=1 Tax=Desulfopila sp. IMCC35006 TaxID=2569542 RepID=UPI0010AD509C|nr:single-stranded-DNA-specific exonuclease RecJ [Desulfopila sp. IMCC35006]TKB27364.1 single-stranded-DNA-specific exonuclease RecJ [Desulfopila sp. IMCC35006]